MNMRDSIARIPTVAIVGHKNSGKTTLVERLVRHFTDSGMRVAAIKHTSDEVGFDKPRSDSDRLKKAGAIAVGMVAKEEIGLYMDRTPEHSEEWLELTCARLPESPTLILYEGYRGGPHPKIECILNPDTDRPSFSPEEGLIAVVSNHTIVTDVPVFDTDALDRIAAAIRSSYDRTDWPPASTKLH
jgi:molybdopterin-guanine dinucleotide biosynthesis protein MobB